jgi:hypothetical protein
MCNIFPFRFDPIFYTLFKATVCSYLLTYSNTYLLTYWLTPWSRGLVEKLTTSQLVKKFPAFYGTRMFITAFTCPYPESDQSSPPPLPIFWRSILILYSHLSLGLPSGLIPSGFSTKALYKPLLSSQMRYLPRLSQSSQFDQPNNIWWGVKIIKRFYPLSCFLVPLRPKYSSQHPTLKHPQTTFLPRFRRPSFTPIQNNGKNYSFVYLKRCLCLANCKTSDSTSNDSERFLT